MLTSTPGLPRLIVASILVFCTFAVCCGSQQQTTKKKPLQKSASKKTRYVLSAAERAAAQERTRRVLEIEAIFDQMVRENKLEQARALIVSKIPESPSHRGILTPKAVKLLIRLNRNEEALDLIHRLNRIPSLGPPDQLECFKAWLYCKTGQYSRAIQIRTERTYLDYMAAAEFPASYHELPASHLEIEHRAALAIACTYHGQSKYSDSREWSNRALEAKPNDCLALYFLGVSYGGTDPARYVQYLTEALMTAPPELQNIIQIKLRRF